MKTVRNLAEWFALLLAITAALAAGAALLHYADPLRILNPAYYTRGQA